MTSALIDSLRKGNRLALSRILSQVENGTEAGLAALEELFLETGSAQKIGITGPPGSGKSTLVNAIARELRRQEGQDLLEHVSDIGFIVETVTLRALVQPLMIDTAPGQGIVQALALHWRHAFVLATDDQHDLGLELGEVVDG